MIDGSHAQLKSVYMVCLGSRAIDGPPIFMSKVRGPAKMHLFNVWHTYLDAVRDMM